MIPLRDINPTRTRPVVNYALIAANTLVFLYQFQLQLQSPLVFELFTKRWGLVPYYMTSGLQIGSLSTPLTSMFMHGDWWHLISNMWFLFIFGDNIEEALGRVRYLAFYLLCGLCAAFAQVAIDPSSLVPMVGASGAIAGVLAAYLRLFPHARVVALIPLVVFFVMRELPAVFFIAIWFGLQLLLGLGALGSLGQHGGGIAFFAHIGGFVAGLGLIALLGPRKQDEPAVRTVEREFGGYDAYPPRRD